VSGLDRWMEMAVDERQDTNIQLKQCPYPIRGSTRPVDISAPSASGRDSIVHRV